MEMQSQIYRNVNLAFFISLESVDCNDGDTEELRMKIIYVLT